jgi:hypothetical protein
MKYILIFCVEIVQFFFSGVELAIDTVFYRQSPDREEKTIRAVFLQKLITFETTTKQSRFKYLMV